MAGYHVGNGPLFRVYAVWYASQAIAWRNEVEEDSIHLQVKMNNLLLELCPSPPRGSSVKYSLESYFCCNFDHSF